MANTSNHGWEIPDVGGDKDVWGQILNDFFDGELDEQVKLEGTFANRPAAGQDTVKYYHATDQRIVYYNDGSSWQAVYGLGTDSNPVPGTSHFESVSTERAVIGVPSSEGWSGVQAALDRPDVGVVRVQAGATYQDDLGETVTIPSNTTLTSDGPGLATFETSDDTISPAIIANDSAVDGGTDEWVFIQGIRATNTNVPDDPEFSNAFQQDGIRLENAKYSNIHKCAGDHVGKHGIKFKDTTFSSFGQVWGLHCSDDGVEITGSSQYIAGGTVVTELCGSASVEVDELGGSSAKHVSIGRVVDFRSFNSLNVDTDARYVTIGELISDRPVNRPFQIIDNAQDVTIQSATINGGARSGAGKIGGNASNIRFDNLNLPISPSTAIEIIDTPTDITFNNPRITGSDVAFDVAAGAVDVAINDPSYENVTTLVSDAGVRTVHGGIGSNGTDDPRTAGDWNAEGRPGVTVVWDDAGTDRYETWDPYREQWVETATV